MSLNRRQFLSRGAAAVAAAPFLFSHAAAPAPAAPPNILFICTDDQAPWTIHYLGDDNPATPNLDRLFSDSVVCDNAFCTTPVCSPARVGLLTSRYGTDVGITDYINEEEAALGLPPDSPTWVRELKRAGYRTGLVGKWHLGVQDKFHPTVFGYDYFAGFREGGTKVVDAPLEIDGLKQPTKGLVGDVLTDLAAKFIQDAQQPFALSVHYRSPHRPWLPVAKEDSAPFTDKPLELADKNYPDLDRDRANQSLREYLESVAGVDRNVGKLMAQLEDRGISDNTVVVFTSDHGYNVGHHGLLFKGNAYWLTRQATAMEKAGLSITRPNMFDTSMRVPLAVRWPARLKAGSRVKETLRNIDWFPTLLAMAGVPPLNDGRIRGRNFLPLLLGENIPWDNSFYGQYDIHHNANASLRMYRTPEWKLIRDFKNIDRNELYHLEEDPDERINLISMPHAWQKFEDMNRILLRMMKEISDPQWSEGLA